MRLPAVVVGVVVALVLMTTTSAVAFQADYPIDSIAQSEGTRLTGTAAERVGISVGGGGSDVDGDGVADFVVGAWCHVASWRIECRPCVCAVWRGSQRMAHR
jgi:hypothetical protein